jgi:hypothetical protein
MFKLHLIPFSEEFFQEVLQIEKEIGIPVFHETHRRRVFYNPWTTRDILLKVIISLLLCIITS